MGMVAPRQRIASAYVVIFGNYGDVTRYAQERGVCRQWVYREAGWLQDFLGEKRAQIEALQQRVQELEQQHAALAERLAMSVVLDEDVQAQLASVGQANGISLPMVWRFLQVLIPGKQLSVATLGRRSQAAGEKSGELLAVFDECSSKRVRDAAADELYVNDPVRMVVEQESLCWISARLGETVDGEGWAEEFRQLPNLEQLARDGGKGLAKGVALVNASRQEHGQPLVVDKADHFHALRGAGVGLRKVQRQAAKALAEAEKAQQELEACQRQGEPRPQGAGKHAAAAWRKAEKAMDLWCQRERLWQQTKEAMRLVTPTGELNTRQQAEALLAQTLPQLPDSDFAKTKRQLQQPEILNYLDHVHQQIDALPLPEAVKQAAVRQECLRRRPEALQGEGREAAARRGVLLACAVILGKTGAVGQQAIAAVGDIFRRAYRASSLVECINSAVRMHQCRHRKMTQGLLDLKRLYWNCHRFRTGRRRGTTPYQRLGVPWPEGLRWWDVLKLTPEQLRHQLSTAKTPP
jgi:hypothetical protein